MTPPRSLSERDPDNPAAPEAATAPLRPTLVADARNFLPPEEEPGGKHMDHSSMDHSEHGAASQETAGAQYVCPMHPTVTSDKPDKCPKCGMKLEKKAAAKPAGDAHQHHKP